jgi:DNA-binding response OmpR family regulator
MNILIIEDETQLLERLAGILKKEKYAVDTTDNGEDGLDRVMDGSYDLILLDIMLPKLNGLEVLREIRDIGIDTPVLMLTAKSDIEDKVVGLDYGADDYLGKPFSLPELLARIRALIRRGNRATPVIDIGAISLNTSSREVFKDGAPLDLTTKEFGILEFLMHNRGRAVSRFTLAEHVWGDEFDPFSMSNFIDVHMSNLRKKLSSPGLSPFITTIRGFGYKIE